MISISNVWIVYIFTYTRYVVINLIWTIQTGDISYVIMIIYASIWTAVCLNTSYLLIDTEAKYLQWMSREGFEMRPKWLLQAGNEVDISTRIFSDAM